MAGRQAGVAPASNLKLIPPPALPCPWWCSQSAQRRAAPSRTSWAAGPSSGAEAAGSAQAGWKARGQAGSCLQPPPREHQARLAGAEVGGHALGLAAPVADGSSLPHVQLLHAAGGLRGQRLDIGVSLEQGVRVGEGQAPARQPASRGHGQGGGPSLQSLQCAASKLLRTVRRCGPAGGRSSTRHQAAGSPPPR